MATTSHDQPRVRAVYIPSPGSDRFVILLGSSVPESDHDTVLAEALAHHLLRHDKAATVRTWAPDSECAEARIDALWAIAFLNPQMSNREVVRVYQTKPDAPERAG